VKVRAAILEAMGASLPYAQSKPLKIEEVELRAPGPGEVLVRMGAAGLCHSDLSVINGDRPRPTPMALGHEAAGVVEALGPGVDDLVKGDHVVLIFIPSCGHCAPCAEGRPALCEPGAAANTAGTLMSGERRIFRDGKPIHHHMGCSAFAEAAVVSRRSVVKIDRELPLEEAALFGCAVLTGVGAVVNTGRVRPGETVVVIGAGGVGLNAIQGARLAGAARIIAVDTSEAKRAVALDFGATDFVLASEPKPWSIARKIAGRGADAVFVTVGAIPAYDNATRYLAPSGRMVMVGMPHSGATSTYEPVMIAATGQAMIGSLMGDTVLARDIRWMVDLYAQGRLKLDELISGRWSLEQINDAIADTRSGAARRNVILF
jgi:alcohol dehydrogenase